MRPSPLPAATGTARERLVRLGITPRGVYLANIQANPIGGRRQDWAYAHYAAASLAFDFGRIAGVDGLLLFAEGNWSAGRNLSEDIGNVFQVGHAFSGDQVALARLYLQQDLFNRRLALAIGRLHVVQTFAHLGLFSNYLSSAINNHPGGLPVNDVLFGGLPNVQWGVQAIGRPTDALRIAAGAFNADARAAAAADHGLDFSFSPADGMLAVGEVGYSFGVAEASGPLPGEVKFGGFYNTGNFPDVAGTPRSSGGLYGVYAIARQMAWRPAGASGDEGLTPWATISYVPKQRSARVPLFFAAGLVHQGPWPARPDDRAAFAVYFGRFSRDIEGATAQTTLEVNYAVQITPWLYVTPDVQYVFNPGGRGDIDNAAVFGGEIGLVF